MMSLVKVFFLRCAPVRQFHIHHNLGIRRKDQTILVFLNRHPFEQAFAIVMHIFVIALELAGKFRNGGCTAFTQCAGQFPTQN